MKPERSLICPVCGKKFFPAPQHIYRVNQKKYNRLVCSYKCSLVKEKPRQK